MIVSPAQQSPDLTTAQKQRDEMKAIEDKKADERAAQVKAERDAQMKPPAPKSVLPKETLGKKLDVTA